MILPPVDLASCADEPIQVPGAIQPHGWLLASEAETGRIVAFSENWRDLAGMDSGPELVRHLQATVDELRPRFATAMLGAVPVSIGTTTIGGRMLDAMVHRADRFDLLELEPASPQRGTQAPIYALAIRFLPRLERASSLSEIASIAATEMQALTGFGRCMVYSFDGEGHGQVLAEKKLPGYESYSGHSFPATDIPAQARALYLLNRIRVIPDANYLASSLHFVDGSLNASAFDLSFAQLRSVSPIHLEYMRNMGTLASMSVSIVVRGHLWGLVSCHDHQPHGLDFETRAACDHLGQLLSLQIQAKEENDAVQQRRNAQSLTLQIVSRMAESDATLQTLVEVAPALLELAEATGVAVVFENECWTAGITPSDEQILALAGWFDASGAEVYETDNLGGTDAPCESGPRAAGLLAISLSDVHRHALIWFRPEIALSIRWAGEPQKHPDEAGRLHPRRSFVSWEEIVRGKSVPWSAGQKAGAFGLRQALIGIVLRHVQERAASAEAISRVTVAREEAERADTAKSQFLAILSHELRTPLGAITSAAELLERFADVPPKFAGLLPMIKRNVALESRLIDDLLDLSSISAGKLNLAFAIVDLHALIMQVVEMLKQDIDNKELRIDIDLGAADSHVKADAVRMQQVVWNILRNAVKFTAHAGNIRLHSELQGADFILSCIDNGIGIDSEALTRIFNAFEQADGNISQRFGGLGLGLAIAAGIVRGHGGELTATSEGRDLGATFTLRIPIEGNRIEQLDHRHPVAVA